MQNFLFVFIALIPILENSLFRCTSEEQMQIFKAHCVVIALNSIYGAYLLTFSQEKVIDYWYKMTSWALVVVGGIFITSICFMIRWDRIWWALANEAESEVDLEN